MKIAVSATDPNLDAQVDPRFGRCNYFVIINPDSMEFESMKNAGTIAEGGAGIAGAQLITVADVKAVLTGNCGPNAERTLRAANVKLYTGATGSVAEAIELFRNGKLTEADGPNVQSRFGSGN